MAVAKNPEKIVDLPPLGDRNADPASDQPGSHPIETGIGAAIGGAATGASIGTVAGPIGTMIGTAVGAVAGGLAGKGIGELIDPTTADNWLRDNFSSRPYVEDGDQFEDFQHAFHYGARAESNYGDSGIDLADKRFQDDWEASKDSQMPWSKAQLAVKDAYERCVHIRKERGANV